ncbi:TonB-dependent siderophore receptor [Nitrococcus mobilis]|uniref:Fe(III)-pyochelin receptor n=1 Tax=Nitrococcus mobilis Nb-231 TaxID=314278 RepID=A4BRG8_9GAMM|nr:TonB-dependent siderophore receptor [Nitrococcus mobilis]EAR21790.1 Fe(III)-pyochelin receptor precursor [Nitrococcus mobilis Nb-231]
MSGVSQKNNRRHGAARRALSQRYLLVPAITAGLALASPVRAQAEEGKPQSLAASPGDAAAVMLPAISVEGEQISQPLTGFQMPVTPREVPQSVSVVPKERIEQQNLFNMEDAMKQSTGVRVERIDANRVNFYSRGFEIQKLQIDGLTTTMDDRLFLSPDLSMYESVQVLKGPAGLLTGSGGAGGAVNLVRKRPRGQAAVTGKLSAGSWDNYRGTLDATGPLNGSGTLRGRAVGTYQDRNSFIDQAWQKNATLYGVLEYDLTPSTLVTAGAGYQWLYAKQPWTLPAYSDFELLDVSRSTYLGADFNRDRFARTSAFAELEQALGNQWLAKVAFRYGDSKLHSDQAFAWGAVDRGTNLTDMWALKFDYREKQTGATAYVTGPITLLGQEHQLLIGTNYERINFHNSNFTAASEFFPYPNPVNVFNPSTDFPKAQFSRSDVTTLIEQLGVYGNARIHLAEPLTLVLGGRVSWWETSLDETGQQKQRDKFNAVLTPLVGLIYDLNNTYSLYASYAETFQPQNFRDADGDLLDPLQGEQLEAGIKAALFGGALNASLAAFRITETNRAQRPANNPDPQVFVARGKVRNQGFEAEISGQVQPGWDAFAGYTYTDTDNPTLGGGGPDGGSAFSVIAPRHLFKLWTNYRLPGDWNQWSLGAGLRATSKIFNEFEDGERLTQSGYATVDARLGYRVNQRLSVSLNVTNIFDKKYYQRINTVNSGNLFGQPRAFMLTLRGQL